MSVLTTEREPVELVRRPRHDAAVVAVQARRRKRGRRALGIIIPIALIALWQAASTNEWIDSTLYPSPTDVISAIRGLWNDADLLGDIIVTLRVVLYGFVIGSLSGLAVGVSTGLSRLTRSALEPLLNGLYVVPKLALLPVFVTLLGFGDGPKVALVAVTTFFFVWISIMETLCRIPEGYLDAARAFGANRRQTFRHVYLPAMLPELFVSLRISMGVSVLVTVAAEFLVGGQGLGYLIFHFNQLFLLDRVYAAIVCVAILGVLLMRVVAVAGRLLAPWEQAQARKII